MIKRKDIACTVVLYNPDFNVINNVKKISNLLNHTVLIDNSTKNNADLFKKIPKTEYIPLEKNTGIAHATNIGISRTKEPYIITMDQDSTISSDLIDAYLNFLNYKDHKDIGALTPLYETDRKHVKRKDINKKVLLSMQSGTLFKRSIFSKIGLFNEDLFLDVVDWEYFLRMNKNGLKLMQINQAVLTHQPAVTKAINLGLIKLKYGTASPVRYYYQARNLLWTARKYNSGSLYATLVIKWLKIVLLFNNKKVYLRLFKQGLKDASNDKLGKYISNRDQI